MTSGYMGFTCGSGILSANVTRYWTLPYIGIAIGTTELVTRLPYTENIARKMLVKVSSNSFEGDVTVTLLKNGAATSLTLDVPVATTGVFTVTADVSITDGDMLNVEVVVPAFYGGNITIYSVGVSFLCQ